MSNKKIVHREVNHIHHIRATNYNEDTHLINETIYTDDGEERTRLLQIKNYERPFYITRPQSRNHDNSKKDYEEREKLLEYHCTESDLTNKIAEVTDQRWVKGGYKALADYPYLYGSDPSSSTLIRNMYNTKYPGAKHPKKVAGLDIETDVVNGTGEIIVMSTGMGKKIHCTVLKSFLKNMYDPIGKFNKLVEEHLSEYGLDITFTIEDDERDVIRKPIAALHEWKPALVEVWNVAYDIPFIEDRANQLGMNVAALWADPAVPPALHRYNWIQGKDKMVTISGVVKSLKPPSQWHILETSASFTVIDGMCVYKQLRSQEPELPSYSLDNILSRELGKHKLKFDVSNGLENLAYHIFMQERYPLEYCLYNIFDTYSMLLLEEKTKDLSVRLPTELGCTDYRYTPTKTRRGSDKVNLFLLKKGRVAGTVGRASSNQEDLSLPLSGYILTLPAYLCNMPGAKIIEEYPDWLTSIYLYAFDVDLVSSYPKQIGVMNVSKGTTRTEVINMKLRNPHVKWVYENISSMVGPGYGLTYVQQVYSTPSLDEMLELV